MREDEQEKQYIKSFNHGYLLTRYAPDIADELNKASGDSLSLTAFKHGRLEYYQELKKERLPSWLKGERYVENKDIRDLDKDQDIDPER